MNNRLSVLLSATLLFSVSVGAKGKVFYPKNKDDKNTFFNCLKNNSQDITFKQKILLGSMVGIAMIPVAFAVLCGGKYGPWFESCP